MEVARATQEQAGRRAAYEGPRRGEGTAAIFTAQGPVAETLWKLPGTQHSSKGASGLCTPPMQVTYSTQGELQVENVGVQ